MRKIIAGQIMMWTNLCFIVIGYLLFDATGITNGYVHGLLGVLGVAGAFFNLFIAITLQVKGYSEKKIVDLLGV